MGWNSFVCFTVDKENCGEPAKQQRKGKNRTRRKLMLCFLSELLCLSFIHAFNKSARHLEFLIYDVIRGKTSAAIFEF